MAYLPSSIDIPLFADAVQVSSRDYTVKAPGSGMSLKTNLGVISEICEVRRLLRDPCRGCSVADVCPGLGMDSEAGHDPA